MRNWHLLLAGAAAALPAASFAAPHASRGIAVDGAVAYQDDSNPKQWHYMPLRTDASQNFGINAFAARYWGIGPAFFSCPSGNTADCYSAVGAVLGGNVSINISPGQQKSLVRAISAATGTPSAQIQLMPAKLRNVKIQPVLASNTFEFGKNSDQIWPTAVDIGSSFAYTVGTGGSLFATALASGDATSYEVTPNPLFGLNIAADVEVVGDPWIGSLSCDLKQVWHEVRKSFGVSAKWGWFELGKAQYDSLWQDLQKSGACNLTLTQGSLDASKYGNEMFDLAKRLFEQINAQAAAGTGFFKFEPLPEQQNKAVGFARGLFSSRSVKVNASYSEKHFAQSISWNTTIRYNGRYNMPVNLGVTLAVSCNQATKHMFADLGNTADACLTQTKVDEFNRRAGRERAAKDRVLADLWQKYVNGQIDDDRYEKAVNKLKEFNLTETFVRVQSDDSLINEKRSAFLISPLAEASVEERIEEFLREALR